MVDDIDMLYNLYNTVSYNLRRCLSDISPSRPRNKPSQASQLRWQGLVGMPRGPAEAGHAGGLLELVADGLLVLSKRPGRVQVVVKLEKKNETKPLV